MSEYNPGKDVVAQGRQGTTVGRRAVPIRCILLRPRCIGVVMSGVLDDGTAGLWAIKDKGGVALVQDPLEAMFDSMPQSSIDHVDVDAVGSVLQLADRICSESGRRSESIDGPSPAGRHEVENLIAAEGNGLKAGVVELGKVSQYTCPDCWIPSSWVTRAEGLRVHEASRA